MTRFPLIMTLLVRDEADIVAYNIEHHLAQGVDHVIAIDNGSRNGTTEILEAYRDSGVLTLIREPSDEYLQDVWATRMAHLAHERFGPCWIISNDADEFWTAENGNLKAHIPRRGCNMVRCWRRNMITASDWLGLGAWHQSLLFRIAEPAAPPRLENPIEDPLEQPFFYYDVPPKLIFFSEGLTRISRGAHDGVYTGKPRYENSDLAIFHFPVRSRQEFARSVRQIGGAVDRRQELPRQTSWKYRRWSRMLRRHRSEERVLRDALPSASRLNADLAAGRVVRDRSLAGRLSRIGERISHFS